MQGDKTIGNPAIPGDTSSSPSRAVVPSPKDPIGNLAIPGGTSSSPSRAVVPSPKDPKRTSSAWKELLDFLYEGGFKSLIVLVVSIGAILITLKNDEVCKGAPSQEGGETIALVQPNPICSKYFELTFLILGGYLGLSLPAQSKDSNIK